MDHVRRLRLIAALLIAALGGCSGLGESYESRICWEGGLPVQCDRAYLEFTCPAAVAVHTPDTDSQSAVIATQMAPGMDTPQIGQLFSQFCPPECMPLFVTGGSPFETLHRDVQDILQQSGYRLQRDADEIAPVLDLDLTLIDVRSDDPGWTDLRITTRARVDFQARLTAAGGRQIWAEDFTGADTIEHAYVALGDYQVILSNAYCQALDSFAEAVTGGALDDLPPDGPEER